MIVNKKSIEVDTNQSTVKFEINNEDGHLYSVLSELYSDPIGSTFREISTNCNDAHIMSRNEDRPFIIKLPNSKLHINEIAFRDFGPGLGIQDVLNIYKVYGKSTKNKTNKVTGCLGLGSKSPYSIATTFYVKSYLDGVIYLYTCSMDNNSIPTITDKPTEMSTEEENGLEVIIPIYQELDYRAILTKVLKYFKVKPLIYKQMGNLDSDQIIDIEWDPIDGHVELTNSIYVPKEIKNSESYIDGNFKKTTSEVVQLQIHYPIDNNMILDTINRFNRTYIDINGNMNDDFKISKVRIGIIKFLLERGIIFHAEPGMIAFSPSREYIKYTDLTLDYMIKELNIAAKYIERIMMANFNKITSSRDSFFNTYILDYEKYTRYLKFCERMGITESKDVNFKDYYDLYFKKDIAFDHILGEVDIRETVNEKKIADIFSTYYQNSHMNSGKRSRLSSISKKNVTMVDVFDQDAYKKIPNLKHENINLLTAVLTDRFKLELNNILSDLKEEILVTLDSMNQTYFDEIFKDYNDSVISYDDLMLFCNWLPADFSINYDSEVSIQEQGNVFKRELTAVVRTTNTYKKYRIKDEDKLGTRIENVKIKYKLDRVRGNIDRLIFDLKKPGTDIENTYKMVFFYYLGRFLLTYNEKKAKINKTDLSLDLFNQFDLHNIFVNDGYNDSFSMYNKYLNKDAVFANEHLCKADPLFACVGLGKFKNDKMVINLVSYIYKKFLAKPEILEEQLSLRNYDLTEFMINDLNRLNVPNLKCKVETLKDVEIKVRAKSEVGQLKAMDTVYQPSKLYNSEVIYLDISEEEAREVFKYFGILAKHYLKNTVINHMVGAVSGCAPKYDFGGENYTMYPQDLKDTRYSQYKETGISRGMSERRPFNRLKDIAYEKDVLIIKRLLELEYSIENFNTYIRGFNALSELKISDFEIFKNISKYSNVREFPYLNKIVRELPKKYDYTKLVYKKRNVNARLDQGSASKLLEELKENYRVVIYPSKPLYNLKSRTYVNVPEFEREHFFKYTNNDKAFHETLDDITLKNSFKKQFSNIIQNDFDSALKLYNEKNGTNYISLSSNCEFGSILKKKSYNFYQLFAMLNREQAISRMNTLSSFVLDNEERSSRYFNVDIDKETNFMPELFGINTSRSYGSTDQIRDLLYNLVNNKNDEAFSKYKKAFSGASSSKFEFIKFLQLKLCIIYSFNDFKRYVNSNFPWILIGSNLEKDLRVAYNAYHKQIKTVIKDFFGTEIYNRLNTKIKFQIPNIKHDGSMALNNSKIYDSIQEFIDEMYNENLDLVHLIVGKLNFFRDGYMYMDNIRMKDVEVIRTKLSDYIQQPRIVRFLGTVLGCPKKVTFSYGMYQKIVNYEKHRKFLNLGEHRAKFEKIKYLLRENDSTLKVEKMIRMERINQKININTMIESRKIKMYNGYTKKEKDIIQKDKI